MTFHRRDIPMLVDQTVKAIMGRRLTDKQFRSMVAYAENAGGSGRTARMRKKRAKATLATWYRCSQAAMRTANALRNIGGKLQELGPHTTRLIQLSGAIEGHRKLAQSQ